MHLLDGLSSGLGLNPGGIADVEKAIMRAIGSKETLNDGGPVILVLDGLDFLLAATECEVLGVLDMIGELREVGIRSVRILAQCSWLTEWSEKSTSVPRSLPQLPICRFLDRALLLSKYTTQLS